MYAELSLVKLPALRDMQAWGLMCFGPGGDRQDENDPLHAEALSSGEPPGEKQGSEGWVADPPGLERISGPLLKTVLALDQVGVTMVWLDGIMQGLSVVAYLSPLSFSMSLIRTGWLLSGAGRLPGHMAH